MAAISETIAALRRKRGLTQEQLGSLVGVSAQAVSKWEKGGAPDVELLPALADRLGVTIDALFGRGEQRIEDMDTLLRRWLNALPPERRQTELFRLLSRTMNSLGVPAEFEDLFTPLKDLNFHQKSCFIHLPDGESSWVRTKVATEEGLALGVPSDDLPFYLLMPEPEAGYAANLLPPEEYRPLFAALSRPGVLEALCWFEEKKDGFYATASAVARGIGRDREETGALLEELAGLHLLHRADLEAEEGAVGAYQLNDQSALVPFLILARWLLEKNETWIFCWDLRKRPMLSKKENTDEAKH